MRVGRCHRLSSSTDRGGHSCLATEKPGSSTERCCSLESTVSQARILRAIKLFGDFGRFDCRELTGRASGAPPSPTLVWPLVFCIHFLFCQPVSCRVYDDVKGTASPPDHLSYPSPTIVICSTGDTKGRSAWLGVVCTSANYVVGILRTPTPTPMSRLLPLHRTKSRSEPFGLTKSIWCHRRCGSNVVKDQWVVVVFRIIGTTV